MSLIDDLDWDIRPDVPAEELFAALVAAHETALRPFVIHADVATLPFYEHWKLLRLHSVYRKPKGSAHMEDLYALWRADRPPLLLDGSSDPVHEVNDDESLALDEAHAADYVRFFFFAVRAEDHPFILFEQAPAKVAPDLAAAATDARPLTAVGRDDHGAMLFDATVIFRGTSFKARLALPPDGQITMIDDDPLTDPFPPALTLDPPVLGIGRRLRAQLSKLPSGAKATVAVPPNARRRSSTAKHPRSDRPTIVELVELLLERAVRDQARNRLLGFFNATLPGPNALLPFASLMRFSSPVVVVESAIPFVEETIAQVVNDILPAGEELELCRGSVSQDASAQEVLERFSLPSGPAIVLIPFQVYRRVMFVERLAYDLAASELAAIITCERVDDLPPSLRRNVDLVLRLPSIDAAIFETLFVRVMGAPMPKAWHATGNDWVKYLLHTDFEHPRRMKLAPREALRFIREQVTDRLRVVDPATAMGLSQLYGMGEARQFAEDLIADIHAAIHGQLPWTQVDRGALLVGAPGTGKTTLAKAIAKDCGVRFIQASASGWMAEGVSLGPHIQAIRRTFSEARAYAPSIVFIDEIDSLGSREQFAGDNNSVYQTEVVNAVLEQMQGLDPSAPVFVIAATNHEDRIDPALLRSGRLDRVIRIPRPNADALDHIYRSYLGALGSGVTVAADVRPKALAQLSVGLTGADVERIVRGAVRRARKASHALSQVDLLDEITNKPRGSDGPYRLTPDDLQRTAAHEAGHALAAFLTGTKGADIGFVSIVPRDDGTLGFMAPVPDERVHLTRRDYEDRLEVYLAGRAAEELTYGSDQVTSGAGSDLRSATAIVTQMVTQLALGGNGRLLWSEALSTSDAQVAEAILAQAYDRVLRNLRKHQGKLVALADALAVRQELPGDDVRAILKRRTR